MADDVLHAAVVEQHALVLEARVAAHRGPTPCRAGLTVCTVPFGLPCVPRKRPPCQKGQPGTAASCKRRSKRKGLPASLRPRPDGYPWHPCATNSTARDVLARLDAGALRQHLALGWETKSRREDSSERSRALPKPGVFAFPRPSRPPARPALDRW